MNIFKKSSLGYFFLIVGGFLLFFTLVGEICADFFKKNITVDQLLQQRIPDEQLKNASSQELMIDYMQKVAGLFQHKRAAFLIFDNWCLWLMGLVDDNFNHIRSPDHLLKYSTVAWCDQSSYLLLTLALKSGIQARHVGLEGHVVMEAWYDNDWHMFDPDFNWFSTDNSGKVLSVQFLSEHLDWIEKTLKTKNYSKDRIQRMLDVFKHRNLHTFMTYPFSTYFSWKSQVLYKLEIISDYIKWVVPLLLLILGYRWTRKKND